MSRNGLRYARWRTRPDRRAMSAALNDLVIARRGDYLDGKPGHRSKLRDEMVALDLGFAWLAREYAWAGTFFEQALCPGGGTGRCPPDRAQPKPHGRPSSSRTECVASGAFQHWASGEALAWGRRTYDNERCDRFNRRRGTMFVGYDSGLDRAGAGPVTCPVLVGRTVQLASLKRALQDASRGMGQTVLLAGEAGIGKSRLVGAAKARANLEGFLLLESTCFEPDRNVPYAPLIDLLRAQLLGRGSDDVAQVLGSAAPTLIHLVPELAVRLPGIAATPPLEPEQQRHRLFHALVELLVGLTRAQPVLLIIEDLHWCDTTSLDFLRYVARRLARLPVLLLLSYRLDEPQPSLRHLLAELDRERLATELSLAPLSRAEVETMLRATLSLGRPVRAEFLDAIYGLTDGNPFFIEEVLKALVVTGDLAPAESTWDRTPLDVLRVPRTIEDAVLRRLVRVSPAAQRVARVAAVAGRRFNFVLLEMLAAEDEPALLLHLKELVAAQLLVDESADGFAFRHALTRQAIYAQLLVRERQTLHDALVEHLERLSAGSLFEAHLPDLAYHAYRAGNWAKIYVYARHMGERAQAMDAPQAAVVQFSHALEAARRLGNPPSPAVLRARGQAYEVQGDFEGAHEDYRRAFDMARAGADRRAEWQGLLDLGFLWLTRDLLQAGALFRDALALAEVLGDPTDIAHTQNRLGNWSVNRDQPGPGLDLHRRALTRFEALGDRSGVAQTLDLLAVATYVGGDRRGAIIAFERAAEQFRALEDRRGLASVLATLAHLRCGSHIFDTLPGAAGSSDQAVRECEEALGIARAIGWRSGEAYASCGLAACLSAEGEYGRALTAVREGQAIAEELEHRGWLAVAHLAFGMLELDLLDAGAARQHFERAYDQAQDGGSVRLTGMSVALLALAHVLDEQGERAAATLRAWATPDAPVATHTQSLLLSAYGEACLARGDAGEALAVAEQLIAWADAAGGPGVVPRLEKLRGDALAALGQTAAAEVALRAAAETAREQGARPLLWRLHLALGRLLYAHGRRREAEHDFATARAIVAELAATLPGDLNHQFQARALARVPAPQRLSPASAAKQKYGGLTAREREVVMLIGRGLSNRAIADALVVSERTVETHTGHILDKLGCSSRAQITAWAVDKGLVRGAQ
jgi:DNA-binding CsgD family transcriptional regulator/tetratricopeptide (TPR) repeat protein